jgi:hypothetical protein
MAVEAIVFQSVTTLLAATGIAAGSRAVQSKRVALNVFI